MNDDMKNIFTQLKHETLSAGEREELRTHVVSFMEANPAVLSMRPRRSAYNTASKRAVALLTGLALALGTGAGVSYAAEGSLPGDALYPVKIRMNEGVRAAFTVSAEAKAEFARRQLERRAEEAEALVKKHRLSAEAKATLAAEANVHFDVHKKAQVKMEDDGDIEESNRASEKLEHTIAAHKEVIVGLGINLEERKHEKEDRRRAHGRRDRTSAEGFLESTSTGSGKRWSAGATTTISGDTRGDDARDDDEREGDTQKKTLREDTRMEIRVKAGVELPRPADEPEESEERSGENILPSTESTGKGEVRIGL